MRMPKNASNNGWSIFDVCGHAKKKINGIEGMKRTLFISILSNCYIFWKKSGMMLNLSSAPLIRSYSKFDPRVTLQES